MDKLGLRDTSLNLIALENTRLFIKSANIPAKIFVYHTASFSVDLLLILE
jgi:hypothetical protein